VGFHGAFAARTDVGRFIFERMGFAGAIEDLVKVDRDCSRVWMRALANIARGTSPPLLRRTAAAGDVESLMAFCAAPFSQALFWPEHALSGGAGAGAEALPRPIGRQADGAPIDAFVVLAAHRGFDTVDSPRLAHLHNVAREVTVGRRPPPQDPIKPARFAELLASFEAGPPAGAGNRSRERCERALAALLLLQLPLPELPPPQMDEGGSSGAGGGGGGGGGGGAVRPGAEAAAARARLELRRHALFTRVLALLRGDEDHAPLWREMLASAAPRAAPRA